MFADDLLDAIDKKGNPCVVGLDPDIEKIPEHLRFGDFRSSVASTFLRFNCEIIDAVADLVPAVKPQIAFYEKYGSDGFRAFEDTVSYAQSRGLIVIEDGKRNDIGNTSRAYAEGHLVELGLDALTINAYLGNDGVRPFLEVCQNHGKGVFILVKTSNKGSGDLQDRLIKVNDEEIEELRRLGIGLESNLTELYNLVALQVNGFAQQLKGKRGYSSIGAVVGATYPEQARILRKIMPNSIFLVPGYGAQGGTAKDVVPCFNADGYGAVINSSRDIIYAYLKLRQEPMDLTSPLKYKPKQFADAARESTKRMIENICFELARLKV